MNNLLGENGRDSAVDRLIQLAVKDKAPEKTSINLALEDPKGARPPMWRLLLQLRVLLPYITRLMPLVEGSSASPVSQEVRHGMAELQGSHRDLRLQMQDHAIQLKRVEEQLTRLRETSERNDYERTELAQDVKSIGKLLHVIFGTVVGLLLILIVMLGFVLLHTRH
jgi:tetrahydromethanopterin S-methyltransferase subunit G